MPPYPYWPPEEIQLKDLNKYTIGVGIADELNNVYSSESIIQILDVADSDDLYEKGLELTGKIPSTIDENTSEEITFKANKPVSWELFGNDKYLFNLEIIPDKDSPSDEVSTEAVLSFKSPFNYENPVGKQFIDYAVRFDEDSVDYFTGDLGSVDSVESFSVSALPTKGTVSLYNSGTNKYWRYSKSFIVRY